MKALAPFYVLVALHVVTAIVTRMKWRRRGLEWSSLDTAACIVGPIALVLGWLLVLGLVGLILQFCFPQLSSRLNSIHVSDWVAVSLCFVPPLLVFWTWFLLSSHKKKEGTDSASTTVSRIPGQ
jgi:hypothetical protein